MAWPASDQHARMAGMTAGRPRLFSGDFGRFWLGQTVSNLGSSFTFFALPLLVFNLTGSPINLGITTAAEFVPYLLFGLVIGAWVDRVDRRRLMIATDLAGRPLSPPSRCWPPPMPCRSAGSTRSPSPAPP
jgi:hypothetical protein